MSWANKECGQIVKFGLSVFKTYKDLYIRRHALKVLTNSRIYCGRIS